MPVVSVILNCYNHRDYVAEAITSVLDQTFRHFELIIIDNGSTDGTTEIIKSFDDARIRTLWHRENVSLSRRLNEGVQHAAGAFVSVLYSDDYFLPHKLERQIALFEDLTPDYGVVYSPALAVNQLTGEWWRYQSYGLSGQILAPMLTRHFEGAIDMCSPLIRRECLLNYPFFDDLFSDGEAVFFRIAMRYLFKFDPEPVVVLRDHGGNMGKAIKKNHEMLMVALDRLENHPDFPKDCHDYLRHFRTTLYRNHSWTMLRMGTDDVKWVRKRLWRAIRLEPRQLLHPRMFASLALAALPRTARRMLNGAANKLRAKPENRNLVDSYE